MFHSIHNTSVATVSILVVHFLEIMGRIHNDVLITTLLTIKQIDTSQNKDVIHLIRCLHFYDAVFLSADCVGWGVFSYRKYLWPTPRHQCYMG